MAAVFFVLLLVVQIAFLVVARSTVGSAVDAATRDAAREPQALGVHEDRLADRIMTAAPTAVISSVELVRSGDEVSARVVLRWVPPGPDLVPVIMTVESRRSVAVPP